MKKFNIKYKEQDPEKNWVTKYKIINATNRHRAIIKLDKWPGLIRSIKEIKTQHYEEN